MTTRSPALVISAAQLADFLGAERRGRDVVVTGLAAAGSASAGTLVFLARAAPQAEAHLNTLREVLCITTPELAATLRCPVLLHDEPRLAFCQAAEAFFTVAGSAGVHASAVLAASARLGAMVTIGPGSVIGEGVRIDAGTTIGANVVIADGVHIGSLCLVKSNTTIGERGFGFARDAHNVPVAFPHVGTVSIGDHVEIGANCTVVRAALEVTRVEDHVKTDDHVHIAHNCHIGARSYLAAGAIVSGSVTIGCDVWIGPNATLTDYLQVGDRARIGLGAVVTRTVEPDCTVFGNPARVIKRGAQGG